MTHACRIHAPRPQDGPNSRRIRSTSSPQGNKIVPPQRSRMHAVDAPQSSGFFLTAPLLDCTPGLAVEVAMDEGPPPAPRWRPSSSSSLQRPSSSSLLPKPDPQLVLPPRSLRRPPEPSPPRPLHRSTTCFSGASRSPRRRQPPLPLPLPRTRRGRRTRRPADPCTCRLQRLRSLPAHSHRCEGRRWSPGGRGSARCRGLQQRLLSVVKRRTGGA